jgi:hypothetical protein
LQPHSKRSVYVAVEDQAVMDKVLEVVDTWNEDYSRGAISYSHVGGRVGCLTTNNPQDVEQMRVNVSAIPGVVLFDFIEER